MILFIFLLLWLSKLWICWESEACRTKAPASRISSRLTEAAYLWLAVSESLGEQACSSLPLASCCCSAPHTQMRHLQPSLWHAAAGPTQGGSSGHHWGNSGGWHSPFLLKPLLASEETAFNSQQLSYNSVSGHNLRVAEHPLRTWSAAPSTEVCSL